MKKKLLPPCIIGEKNFCRNCPGWEFMVKAQKEGKGLWGQLPIHCSITGLTIYPKDTNNKRAK